MDIERKGLRAPDPRETQTRPVRRTVHAAVQWVAAVAVCGLLAACGGGGGDDPAADTSLPSILANATPYGADTDPPPQGARQVSRAELEELAATSELIWVTPATERGVGNPLQERLQRDRAFLETQLATRPELAPLLEPVTRPPGALRRSDGTVEVTLPASGEVVALDPPEFQIATLAHALRMEQSRPNAIAVYRNLWDSLAEDLRASLPSLESAETMPLDELRAATERAADLVIETVPDEPPPGDPVVLQRDGRARALAAQQALAVGSNCAQSTNSPANDFSFTLKPHQPPVRSQGRRGNCVAFAATAGVEIRASRMFGRQPDLSEQHAYSAAKYDWFRSSGDDDDGLFVDSMLEKLIDESYRFRGEATWRYNPSPKREEGSSGYVLSCVDYPEACSDTNHQRGKIVFQGGGKWWSAFVLPASTAQGLGEEWRLKSASFLGPMLPEGFLAATTRPLNSATLKVVRSMLLNGSPVVLDMAWPTCAANVTSAPTVFDSTRSGLRSVLTNETCIAFGGGAYNLFSGYHALNIVGFIPYSQILTRYAGNPRVPAIDGDLVNDGWYIVRNSHGCAWGDGGYAYFSGQFLRRFARGFYSINLVAAQNLGSVILTPQKYSFGVNDTEARLTASVSGTIQKMQLYAAKPDSDGYDKLGGEISAPFNFAVPRQRMQQYAGSSARFYVQATDGAGNVFTSAVAQIVVPANVATPPVANPIVRNQVGGAEVTSIAAPAAVVIYARPTPGTMPIKHVDFYKGLTPIGSSTSPSWFLPVALTTADVGRVTYLVRVEDTIGNFATATVSIDVTSPVAPPSISAFTASPSIAPPGGGPVTLSWNASGATSLAIDKVGPVTNLTSVQVSPTVTTTYVLTATNAGGTASAERTVTVPPPQVASFTATPASLPLGGGPVTLSWNVVGAASVNINNGVGSVAGSGSVVVNPVVSTTWTLVASAPSGSSNATAAVAVAADTVPPTVTLAASPATVDAPGSTTLTASATDNVGVVAVEFFRGATRIGSDTTPGDGFTQAVSFAAGDVGNVSFTAVARDAAGNTAASLPVVVVVRTAVPLGVDRWVAPNGSDANPGSEAAPYLTVGKALAHIGASGTVWLAPGTYPWANEINRNGYSQVDMKVLRVPDTGRVRALTRGTVTLNFGLQALGSAVISGVHFSLRADDVSDWQPSVLSKAAGGTLRVERTTFGRMNNLQFSAGGNTLLTAEGDATHEWFTPEFQGAFGRVDVGQTRVLGGRITLTRIPDGGNASTRVWGNYAGSGLVSFESVQMTLPEAPAGVFQILFQPVQGGTLTFQGSQVVQQGTRTSHVLAQNDHQSLVRLINSTVSGPFAQVVSLTVGGDVEVNGSTLSSGVTGIGFAGGQEPGGVAPPRIQLLGSTLRNFSAHGLYLPNHGEVTVSGSTIRDNGQTGLFLGGTPNLPWVTANYSLRMQTSVVSGNGSGGASHGGVVMAGSAASIWDLGGFNGAGSNTLLGTAVSPALRVAVPQGATVLAVGNTWTPSEQGASASGQYSGSLVVTSGRGVNYVVDSGALQLSY